MPTKPSNMMDNYTFEEHRHNYSVWTAARAVSRNFTTTANVKKAIATSDLRNFTNSNLEPTQEEFDCLHVQWATQLISSLTESTGAIVSYGRAAKIISIYLKTSVVLCNQGNCAKSLVIHPPIDGILLNSIAKKIGLKELTRERWTQLDKENYWELVNKLKTEFGSFDWKLEYFWRPDRD